MPTVHPHLHIHEKIVEDLASGDSIDAILQGYFRLEAQDIQVCLLYARRLVGHERVESFDS